MNFATMLATGPRLMPYSPARMLSSEETNAKVLAAIPGTMQELIEATGKGKATVVRAVRVLIDEGKAAKKNTSGRRNVKRYIYVRSEE